MAQRAVFYTEGRQGELRETPGVSATPVRFSALRSLEPMDAEALRFLRQVAVALSSTQGSFAVYGPHVSLRALLGLAPKLLSRLRCRIVDGAGQTCPVLPELPSFLPESLPGDIGAVYFNLPGTVRAQAMRKRLPAGVAVVTPEQVAAERPALVPLRAWVPVRESLYPLDIPEIRIPSGLDVLLVDSLAKNMGFMPNGLGYVHNTVKKTGLSCATFDLDIVVYHRFHARRLLDAPWLLRTPQGRPVPDDPWRAELGGLWQQEDFLSFFEEDIEEFCSALRAAAPRVVGFSVHEANALCASRLAERVRRDLPDTLIIAGGYSCLDPVFAHAALPIADYTVVGEAETVLGPLVQRLIRGERPGNVPGVISRFDLPGRRITAAEPPQDLDALDPPDYEWFGPGLYRNHNGYQLIPITKSRGCRWARCTFCTERFPWRTRSAKSVADELEWHYLQGGDHFLFNDSDFNADRAVMLELCEEIKRRDLRIRLTGQLRIDRRNTAEYFKKLRSAGFVSLHFGVDAWSRRSLVTACKGYTVPTILENLKACREAGLFCEINLIVAYPGETEEDVDETIANIVEARPYIGRIAVINPLLMKTGCLFWEKSEEYGIQFIADKDELACRYPTGIPSHFWHATSPLLDEERRNARVCRVVKALEQHGIPIGEVATASLDDMETGQDALRGSQRFGLARRVQGLPERHQARGGRHLLQSGQGFYLVDQAGLETLCGALGKAPKAELLSEGLSRRELHVCEAVDPGSVLLVSEGAHGYNIVQLGARFAAIRQGVPFDPLRFAAGSYAPDECILGESVIGLMRRLEEENGSSGPRAGGVRR